MYSLFELSSPSDTPSYTPSYTPSDVRPNPPPPPEPVNPPPPPPGPKPVCKGSCTGGASGPNGKRDETVTYAKPTRENPNLFDYIFKYSNAFAIIGALYFSINSFIKYEPNIDPNIEYGIILYVTLCSIFSLIDWFNIKIPYIVPEIVDPAFIRTSLLPF